MRIKSRSRPNHPEHAPLVDHLETRQMLAADLGVRFDEDGFRAPTIVVPGDRFNPDDSVLRVPIEILNSGPQSANGLVTINFYLSTDNVLNTSSDILLRSFAAEPIFLPVFSGDPNDIGTFSPDMRIGPDVAPGRYFVIVRISPNSQVGDFNSSNNIAVTDTQLRVERRFGAVGNRQNVPLALRDAEGTIVAFTLSGGGSGEASIDNAGRFFVDLTGAGANSDLTIETSGGDGSIDLGGVNFPGALRSITARSARLVGSLNVGTSIASITLGDVLGPASWTIPATSVRPSFAFANVTNLSITSAVGIDAISATTWLDTDTTPDAIVAPTLGGLTTTGNFGPSLRLSGGVVPGTTLTLRSAAIGGVIKSGAWNVNGSAGSISLFSAVAGWVATFNGSVGSLTSTNTFRGTFTALNIGPISVGRDILATRIYAGTYYGSDGVAGGSGSAGDSFRPGRIESLSVVRNIANSTIAAGLAPLVTPGGTVEQILGGTASRIGIVTAGNVVTSNARFIANRFFGGVIFRGVNINPLSDARFAIATVGPTPALESAVVGGASTQIVALFSSTNLMNASSVNSFAVRIIGPNGFSQLATLNTRALQANSARVRASFTIAAPGGAWTSADNGTYQIWIDPGRIFDVRGNAAPDVQIGQFTINV